MNASRNVGKQARALALESRQMFVASARAARQSTIQPMQCATSTGSRSLAPFVFGGLKLQLT